MYFSYKNTSFYNLLFFFICRFKNFKEVFDGYKHKVGREEGHCYMTVTNVGPDDCGEIECRAFNKEGNATIRAKLILQCKLAYCQYCGLCSIKIKIEIAIKELRIFF